MAKRQSKATPKPPTRKASRRPKLAVKKRAVARRRRKRPLPPPKKAEPLTPRQIKKIRDSHKASQYIFGLAMGASEGLVARWESGQAKPTKVALKLLAYYKKNELFF
jgi:DNA-binding transcriptional regulator YiaG